MKIKLILCIIVVTTFLSACNLNEDKSIGCTLPPKEFTKADLVGTWVATHLDLRRDTLIIRDDNKYRQLIHLKSPPVDYESDWKSWQIEYAENGLPYLYMEDMHLCAYVPDLINCDQVGGGEENPRSFNSGYWYDFCQEKTVLMPNSGVLIVLGVPQQFAQPARGIELHLLKYTDDSWVYTLQEP